MPYEYRLLTPRLGPKLGRCYAIEPSLKQLCTCESKGLKCRCSKNSCIQLHSVPFPFLLHSEYMNTLLRPVTRQLPLLLRATTLSKPIPGLPPRFAKHPGRAYTTTKSLSAATMASVQQAEWRPPAPLAGAAQEALPKLSMYNSLTRSKNEFVPLDREGKKIGWYACGPTVYDDAVSQSLRGSLIWFYRNLSYCEHPYPPLFASMYFL